MRARARGTRGLGYTPRFHEPEKDDAFSVSIDGAGFDVDDFKTLVRIGEDLRVGLSLDDRGRITVT